MKLSKAQPFAIEHNVALNVIDERTGTVVQHHEGHNAATNSMIIGIAKYLTGSGVFNQGKDMLRNYVPQYISLGTLGLSSQAEDADGLPTGIGPNPDPQTISEEAESYATYMAQNPGYGADGYSSARNNNRTIFGLGLPVTNYIASNRYSVGDLCTYQGVEHECITATTGKWNSECWEPVSSARQRDIGELITPMFPRVKIAYREIVPEQYSELPCTIDVIYSAMISTGALRQFIPDGSDHLFISEAGLWSRPTWEDNGANGLVAGYRIAPPNQQNWAMTTEQAAPLVSIDRINAYILEHPGTSVNTARTLLAAADAQANRDLLRRSIIRVGPNQVVQVIWKIQLGSIEQFGGLAAFYQQNYYLNWEYGG